jgi:Mrp family chromosome partitioning ATPase/capsular polysaccharide biosynthesis protein
MAFDYAPEEPVSLAAAEQAIGPYLRAVKRYWLLVVLVGILAAAMAAVTVARAGKTYQATASVLVTPLPQGSSELPGVPTVVDTGDPARTMQTAASLLDTPQAAQVAARRLGRPWSQAGVMAAVAVTPLGASNVLAVTGQAASAADSARVTNAFATAALNYRAAVVQQSLAAEITVLHTRLGALAGAQNSAEAQALAGQIAQLRLLQGSGREPTMSVSELAVAPGGPSGASTALVVLLALVGGLILGSVAALGIEMFSHPVRDREELLSIFELPTLASLPRMSGRRRRELPPWELDSIGFEQIRMLRVQLSLDGGPVIMLTSAGAGDGKTTVAAALAASFAEVGSSVALIDLDIRKPDLTRVLGVRSIGVTHGQGPRPVPLKIPELPRVQLLPAPAGNLAAFERILGQLPTMLAEARKISDVVIIDTAPVGEVSETLRIAAHVDQVVFVARPRHTDRRRLQAARDMLRRAGAPVVGMVVVGEDPGSLRGDYAYRYSAELNIAGESRTGESRASA